MSQTYAHTTRKMNIDDFQEWVLRNVGVLFETRDGGPVDLELASVGDFAGIRDLVEGLLELAHVAAIDQTEPMSESDARSASISLTELTSIIGKHA